jgi:hypothetical protein
MTSQTSSSSLARCGALWDELSKIAAAEEQTRGQKLKNVLKKSLIMAGGAGAGVGAGMALDHLVLKKLLPKTKNLSPTIKNGALGLTSLGGLLAARKLSEEWSKK